jgi:hypothetical protein
MLALDSIKGNQFLHVNIIIFFFPRRAGEGGMIQKKLKEPPWIEKLRKEPGPKKES